MPKVTICIPMYNQQSIIHESIESALKQNYQDKAILAIDDASTDKTHQWCKGFQPQVRLLRNDNNVGLAYNLANLVMLADSEYIVFLCGDDVFTDNNVVGDIVAILDANPRIGVVDRNYYQYLDGKPGAVTTVRDPNVLISCVNPSGIGIRKCAIHGFSDKIYTEFPSMIKTALEYWGCKKLDYDTVAVRLHKHNLAKKKWYYKESLIQNWYDLAGKTKVLWDFKSNYISVKNRAGTLHLCKEIMHNVKIEPRILLHPLFYFFAGLSLLTPAFLLRWLSDVYRDRVSRHFCKIVPRKYGPVRINIGCGRNLRTDATNLDITEYQGVDSIVDLAEYPWKWRDNSIDGIYASHVMEHLPDQKDFIEECLRVLKPGGFLRLNLPHSTSVTSLGCMGHYRTYSYNTVHQYLSQDYYMFKTARFKSVEKKLNWWYEHVDMDVDVPRWMFMVIFPVNKIMNWLVDFSPRICENLWCYWVGGFREVIWRGEKL